MVWKNITTLGFGIVLILAFHLGADGLLWGYVMSLALALPFLWVKALGKVSLRKGNISRASAIEMAKYSFPLVVGNLAAWILSLSDRYILKFIRGSEEVGIYSASYTISEKSIFLLVTLFSLASAPIAIKIWETEEKQKSQEFLNKLSSYYLMLCLPAAVGLSVLSRPIASIIIDKKYFDGYRIFPFVAFGIFFLGLEWVYQFGLRYYKKTYLTMLCIFVSGGLNIGLNFVLIPKYGYKGAAATTFISYAFLIIMMIIVSRRYFIWIPEGCKRKHTGYASRVLP